MVGLWDIWLDFDGGDIDSGVMLIIVLNWMMFEIYYWMFVIFKLEVFDVWFDMLNVIVVEVKQMLLLIEDDYLVVILVFSCVNKVFNDDVDFLILVDLIVVLVELVLIQV